MVRRFGKLVLAVVLGLSAVVAALLVWSPYRRHDGFDYRLLKADVDIRAACARVHGYLANSANASNWSIYVDHIVPLNVDKVPDGAEGSIRRSFRRADESGLRWDEYFEMVEPLRRRLLIYNVHGAPRTDGELLTEQIYEPLPDLGCRLSFTLFFREDPSLRDAILMRLAAHEIGRIFRRNIANVKQLNEVG